MRITRHQSIAALVAVGIFSSSVASADTSQFGIGDAEVNATAATAREAAPDDATIVGFEDGPGSFQRETVSGTEVSVHEDSGVKIDYAIPGDLRTISSTLSIASPLDRGNLASDGSVVFLARDRSVDAVVQLLDDDAVRVQTVINETPGVYRFQYDFSGGVSLHANMDGSVDIVMPMAMEQPESRDSYSAKGTEASVDITVAQIAPAWAYDANGAEIPTHYEVEGGTLIQQVEVSEDAAFPVVADPTYGHTYGIPTMYLNRAETGSARNAVYFAWLCGLVPFPFNVLCGGNIAMVTKAARDSWNKGSSWCVKYLVAPGVVAGQSYKCSSQR